jgi:hypothetical protein
MNQEAVKFIFFYNKDKRQDFEVDDYSWANDGGSILSFQNVL